MAPARDLFRRWHCGGYGACFAGADSEFSHEKDSLTTSTAVMAKEEEEEEEDQQEEEEGEDVGCSTTSTTSKEGDHPHKGWLQLGIGSTDPTTSTSSSTHDQKARSLELNLFPESPSLAPMTSTALAPDVRPLIPSGLRGQPPTTMTGYRFSQLRCSTSCLGPATEFRVISPPPRPQAGVWFELKAAEIQGKQPFLPQIPKSYLRIKDGRMTVRLLMKYLANKLGLDDESQVEIACRGHQLHPAMSLQYVRDNIWCAVPTAMMATTAMMPLGLPNTDRVMILHYGRRA